ncbi:hypothetical protein KRX57_08115 [Weeksellaceae bacterium TAE3-ERU29]|nr:hypothetical protein [Weeksellaceae bacterium TAE3-ERU29]
MSKLDNFEIEDIEDCLNEFEKSFNITLTSCELNKLQTFDEFCDLAISKINLENVESCTTQQAFYKLRKVMIEEVIASKEGLFPNAQLKDLFPRENRHENIRKIENKLNIKIDILSAPQWVVNTLTYLLLFSFLLLIISFKIGTLGLSFSFLGLYLCKYSKELQVKTLRDLIEKITTDNYLKLRTQANTINKSELKNIMINWFSENTMIKKERLKTGSFV